MRIFIVTLFTGMRQSEVIGLQWQDIDWDKGMDVYGETSEAMRKHSQEVIDNLMKDITDL